MKVLLTSLLACVLAVYQAQAQTLSLTATTSHQPTPYDSLFQEMSFEPAEREKAKLFLSQVCDLYDESITQENPLSTEYELTRLIICGEKTEVYERVLWKWGGEFHFYNGGIPLPKEEYLKRSSESISKAQKYQQQK